MKGREQKISQYTLQVEGWLGTNDTEAEFADMHNEVLKNFTELLL